MTGMDMPFSSLAGGASVVRVPSNTGSFGGVMLQRIETDKQRCTKKMPTVSPAVMVLGQHLKTHLWRLRASLMEFFTTRQLLLAGRGEEASGSSMLGSLCSRTQ